MVRSCVLQPYAVCQWFEYVCTLPLLGTSLCNRGPCAIILIRVRQVEIRAANEIDDAVANAVRDSADKAAGVATGAVSGERTPIGSPVPSVSRPSRPGRGRARLTKRT